MSSNAAPSALGLLLTELSGQMAAATAGYDPEGMAQWGADMQALEGVLTNVAMVLRNIEHGANDLPIEPAVVGTIGTVAALLEAASSAAGEIHSTFRTVHKDELDRIENPRTGESKWDVEANR